MAVIQDELRPLQNPQKWMQLKVQHRRKFTYIEYIDNRASSKQRKNEPQMGVLQRSRIVNSP